MLRKKQLRKMMLDRRKNLSDDYLSQASAAIQRQVLSLPLFQSAKSIFLYISMEKEPSTMLVLRRALEEGKQVYAPKCVNDEKMLAVRLRSISDLIPGRMGILEPADCAETAAPGTLDVILVPCVCASADGKRLGYGGGYYDRFLSARNGNAVCLCFQKMLYDDIPVTETDVRMPFVLTENGLYTPQLNPHKAEKS